MSSFIKNYPSEILERASNKITESIDDVIAIIPIYERGFIAVIDNQSQPIHYQPVVQIGTHGRDFINLSKSIRQYYNYDEAIVALLAFRNIGEGVNSSIYVDIFCNKMGGTTNGNSLNPSF